MESFKDHFSGHADAYARARPTYPAALFDYLTALSPRHALAWDCGTGNGQAAVALARTFKRVVATDASARQLEHASPHPRVEYAVAPAERAPLPSGAVDLVTVAQALHWFDHERFFDEAYRVLTEQGIFAAWTYSGCRVPQRATAAFDRYQSAVAPYWPPERELVDSGYRTLDVPFESLDAPPFELVHAWTGANFTAYLETWSATRRCLADGGQEELATLLGAIRDAWGPGTAPVVWPLHLRVGRK